jgi:hypothetical protein
MSGYKTTGTVQHSRSATTIITLCAWVLLSTVYAFAQSSAPNGSAGFGRLGCWNCHGKHGEGGRGNSGGPYIVSTPLPFRQFVESVRLPVNMMPPYSPILAPDSDLLEIYNRLGGRDAVESPAPVSVNLKAVNTPLAAEYLEFDVEIAASSALTASTASPISSLEYRLSLSSRGASAPSHRLEYRKPGGDWVSGAPDEHGNILADGREFAPRGGTAFLQLRMLPPAAATLVVVEALDKTKVPKRLIVGVGTAVVKNR